MWGSTVLYLYGLGGLNGLAMRAMAERGFLNLYGLGGLKGLLCAEVEAPVLRVLESVEKKGRKKRMRVAVDYS